MAKDQKASSTDDKLPQANPTLGHYILRYTLSASEYQQLYDHARKHLSVAATARAPTPAAFAAATAGSSEPRAAAVRASLRVFALLQTGLTLYDAGTALLARRRRPSSGPSPSARISLFNPLNLRRSGAAALLLLLHRLLYRFLRRLRAALRHPDAAPFRRRHPRAARALTARLAPAIGAGLAGFALRAWPADQLRVTIAIYAATRAAECAYAALDEAGRLPARPRWWGSWLLMPPVFGQLLHAFVFDRDCFPKAYGDFILKSTPNYIQNRPVDYPAGLLWPASNEVVDSLAELSRLKYPPFISPILFPNIKETLPPSISAIAPITSPAHPSIKNISCAVLHPQEPSCLRTYVTFFLKAFPSLAKFFALFLALFDIPRYQAYLNDPIKQLDRLSRSVLRMTAFVTGAIGTSWGSICLFQSLFSRTFLPTQRWFLGGFLGGLWAFIHRENGHAQFMYSLRLSLDSLWNVGVKRRWWKSHGSGDVFLVAASLVLLNSVHELRPNAIHSGMIRKGVAFAKGELDMSSPPKGDKRVKSQSETNDKNESSSEAAST